jgi:hypothetical protein
MRSRELVRLDDALKDLAKLYSRKAKVIEMRFFGGLSVEESAEALAVSPDTIIREWGNGAGVALSGIGAVARSAALFALEL